MLNEMSQWNAGAPMSGLDLGGHVAVAVGKFKRTGESQTTESVPSSTRTAVAHRVETVPLIDGDVLGDPAWTGMVAVTGFRQTAPDEGEPASERTEVRIVFTDDAIFFGVVC